MYDFLIIGQGIAGSMLTYQAQQKGFSVCAFDTFNPNSASNVASGVVNPITGRKMLKTWKADTIIPYAIDTYKAIETELDIKFIYEIPIAKIITSEEDVNLWNSKLEDSRYRNNISSIQSLNNPNIIEAYGIGFIHPTFWMDMKVMVQKIRNNLLKNNLLFEDNLDYSLIKFGNTIKYKNIEAKYIIFAEGFNIQNNPFFNFIPFKPAKGEQFKIYSKELKLDYIINKNIFIIPLGNDTYHVGSTYIWDDETEIVTEEGRKEVLTKLDKIVKCKYEVLDEKAGIRPTIKDRRPVLGAHPKHKNMFVFNGMGTKGISLAPYFSNELLLHITENKEIDKEIYIQRFL